MTELYRKNSAIMREKYARGLAATPDDFLNEQLVFAERPTEIAFWCTNRTALAAGYQPACCDGTVMVL